MLSEATFWCAVHRGWFDLEPSYLQGAHCYGIAKTAKKCEMVYLDQNAAMLHRHVEVYLVRGLICGNYKTASDWSSLCHDVFRPITSIVSLLIALGDSSGSYKQHESLLAVDCSFLFHELIKNVSLYQIVMIWF